MSARGLLRVGSQIILHRQFQWQSTRIVDQTLRADRKCLFTALNKRHVSSGQLYQPMVTQYGSTLHKNVYTKQKRGQRTLAFQEREESSEQQEACGDFDKNDISKVTQNKLRGLGINSLFPVQYHTFKPTIAGRDVIVQARTGTGKTLSFALPIVEKLQRNLNKSGKFSRNPLVLVLAPTRELAVQVEEVFSSLSDSVKVTCIYGGVPIGNQVRELRRGVDVVVGTPGRIMDLMNQGVLNLQDLQHVILDEVDRMLDMGFADPVESIISDCYKSGDKPQTMMYSATMPSWVRDAARGYLNNDYEMINLVGTGNEQTAVTVKQYAVQCTKKEQQTLIRDFVHMHVQNKGRAIVFCQTKQQVDEICSGVLKKESKPFHGGIEQGSRTHILKGFKDGAFKVLVTTDVAARGLDVPDVDLVIQIQPPLDSKYYIHRVGRTGRAGKTGMSILMYNKIERTGVLECEREAKVKFQKLNRPSREQLIELCVRRAENAITEVPEEFAEHFYEAAETLIEKKGAKEMLAAAMAQVSRVDMYSNRSLISGEEGYTTLLFCKENRGSIRETRDHIFSYLKGMNIFGKNMQNLEDHSGVVFDVEAGKVDSVLTGLEQMESADSGTFKRIDVLPEIETNMREIDFRRNNYRGNKMFRDRKFNGGDDDDDDYNASHTRSFNRYGDRDRYSGGNRYGGNRYGGGDRYGSGDRYSDRRRNSGSDRYSDRGSAYNPSQTMNKRRFDHFLGDASGSDIE